MKQQISKADLVQLDYLAVAADGLQDAQDAIASSIVSILGIESWDTDKIQLVNRFVLHGHGPIEPWLEELGVWVGPQPEVFTP